MCPSLIDVGFGRGGCNEMQIDFENAANRGLGLRVGWSQILLAFKLRTCSGGSKIVARAYKSALWE